MDLFGPARVGHIGRIVLIEAGCALETILRDVHDISPEARVVLENIPGQCKELAADTHDAAVLQHGIGDFAGNLVDHDLGHVAEVLALGLYTAVPSTLSAEISLFFSPAIAIVRSSRWSNCDGNAGEPNNAPSDDLRFGGNVAWENYKSILAVFCAARFPYSPCIGQWTTQAGPAANHDRGIGVRLLGNDCLGAWMMARAVARSGIPPHDQREAPLGRKVQLACFSNNRNYRLMPAAGSMASWCGGQWEAAAQGLILSIRSAAQLRRALVATPIPNQVNRPSTDISISRR